MLISHEIGGDYIPSNQMPCVDEAGKSKWLSLWRHSVIDSVQLIKFVCFAEAAAAYTYSI